MDTIDLATILSVINAILSLWLLSIYYKNYKTMKSKFCMGLLFFAGFFLVQALVASYLQFSMTGFCTKEVGNIALVLSVIEALGLGTLLYVTIKPCG